MSNLLPLKNICNLKQIRSEPNMYKKLAKYKPEEKTEAEIKLDERIRHLRNEKRNSFPKNALLLSPAN